MNLAHALNPAALEPVQARELTERLRAAQSALGSADESRVRLEWHRSRVAARAAGLMLEDFLAQLEALMPDTVALGKVWAASDFERGWLEIALTLARRDALAPLYAREARAAVGSELGRYRAAVAARAMGVTPDTGLMSPADLELEPAAFTATSAGARIASSSPAQLSSAPPTLVTSGREVKAPAPETESLRVSVSKLDALLSLSGELTVAQIRLSDRGHELQRSLRRLTVERRARPSRHGNTEQRLEQRLEQLQARTLEARHELEALEKRLTQDTAQLRTIAQELADEVLGARLLPAALLLPPLERLARDLGTELGKRVRLLSSGTDTEMDRKIIDGLRDPLMHMLRNALDHGIETPDRRVERGKPAEGTVRFEIGSSGGTVLISLADDGAGIDLEAVRRRGLERGLIQESQPLSAEALTELIFEPGFSTAARVTEVSGRGVGMDVVRANLARLGGTVSLHSQPGAGSRFTLRVPAQLATTRVLLLRLGTNTVAIPTMHVERTGRVRANEIGSVAGRAVVRLGGQTIPVAELGALLDLSLETNEAWQPFVVLRTEDSSLALIVDSLLIEQEVVVKRLGYPLDGAKHIAGAAVLGSGELVPILSAQVLIERFHLGRSHLAATPRADAPSAAKRYCVLVVDDSITTRTLERSILEAAGFETRVAVDGAQALELLRHETVDLVLSDVEMPVLDGFALTEEIRRDARLAHLPVVLVTSLEAAEHRERGAAAGADAYIVKGAFDQTTLLETIGRLL